MTNRSATRTRPKRDVSIVNPRDLERIRVLLHNRPRDLLLFELALETGLPANQLLHLKVHQLLGLNVGDALIPLRSKGDGKHFVKVGPKTHATFHRYLAEVRPGENDYLFKSRKGGRPLSISSVSRMVSGWFAQIGLKNSGGLLTLRKLSDSCRPGKKVEEPEKDSVKSDNTHYPVKSINSPTMQELAYRELERAIVTARIKPGERLVTEELARQMGVSRIPIREAIGRLEARNFVTVQPNKGIVVNELSEKNLREILEIRLMLELPAAAKAALVRKDAALETLKELNHSYLDAHQNHDAEELLRVNQRFHFTIYREAGMPILLSLIQNLWNQVSPYYHLMFRQTLLKDPKTGHDYHGKMIKGMVARDPENVCRWLKTDLSESTEFVISVMRSMQRETRHTQ